MNEPLILPHIGNLQNFLQGRISGVE